jgi:hypothetical protein
VVASIGISFEEHDVSGGGLDEPEPYEQDRMFSRGAHRDKSEQPTSVLEAAPTLSQLAEEVAQLRKGLAHLRKTSDLADEVSQLATQRKATRLADDVVRLRQDLTHLRGVAALAVETSALRKQLDHQHKATARAEEVAELRKEVAACATTTALADVVGQLRMEAAGRGVVDSFARKEATQKMTDASGDVAQLRKEVAALQSEVAGLLLSDRRSEGRDRQMPPPQPQFPGAPSHLRGLIGSTMPETPGEIYRAQQDRERAESYLKYRD